MRATEGNGRRYVGRRRFLALLSSGLITLSVLGTGTASAAVPNLIVSGSIIGNQHDRTSTATPGIVSTGETLRFTTSIYNADSSNVAQLYFTALVNGSPATVNRVNLTAGSNTASCTYAPALSCSFGQLRAGTGLTIDVILTVPSGTIGAPTGCNVGGEGYLGDHPFVDFHGPAACITGRWALNGSTLSDGGTSHGDFINWFDGAALNGDAVNFHGRFVYLDDNTKNVQNGQVIDRSNRQATSVLVNGINIPATVADEGGVTETFPDCPPPPPGTTFDCRSLTSAWSQVSVANGLSAGTPFSITILFYQGPNNLKGSKPVGYHTWVDTSNVIQSELINKTCVLTTAGVPTANSPIPCLVVSSGGKAVTIWTLHNGGFKF